MTKSEDGPDLSGVVPSKGTYDLHNSQQVSLMVSCPAARLPNLEVRNLLDKVFS